MSTALPVIRGTSQALYPFSITWTFQTTITNAENGNTYRSAQGYPLVKLVLPFDPLLKPDRNTLLNAFNSAKGQFASTSNTPLDVTIDQLYNYLEFNTDEFTSIEKHPTLYGVQWTLIQTAPQNLTQVTTLGATITSSSSSFILNTQNGIPPVPFVVIIDSEWIVVMTNSGGTCSGLTRGYNGTTAAAHTVGASIALAPGNPFPTITNGCIGQYPYSQMYRYKTIKSAVRSGPVFTTAEYAGGLTNFPTTSLAAWKFDETLLSDGDAEVRTSHFIAQWGDLYSFAVTDENGTMFPHVYYAAPSMTRKFNHINNNSIEISLVQMNS